MRDSDPIESQYLKVMNYLLNAFRQEAKAQGHYNSGKLDRSFKYELNYMATKIIGTFYMEDYGFAMDSGVSAERIPFSAGSGAGTSKYIEGLIQYFRSKGFGTKSVGYAFATATIHKREGMPTRASLKYSTTGKRTGFIMDAYDKSEDMIYQMIQFGIDLDVLVDQLVSDFQKEIKIS